MQLLGIAKAIGIAKGGRFASHISTLRSTADERLADAWSRASWRHVAKRLQGRKQRLGQRRFGSRTTKLTARLLLLFQYAPC